MVVSEVITYLKFIERSNTILWLLHKQERNSQHNTMQRTVQQNENQENAHLQKLGINGLIFRNTTTQNEINGNCGYSTHLKTLLWINWIRIYSVHWGNTFAECTLNQNCPSTTTFLILHLELIQSKFQFSPQRGCTGVTESREFEPMGAMHMYLKTELGLAN